jgi:hypothetical protein
MFVRYNVTHVRTYNNKISNNIAYDTAVAAGTMLYGFAASNCQNATVIDDDFKDVTTIELYDTDDLNLTVRDDGRSNFSSLERSGAYQPAAGTTLITVGELTGLLAQHVVTGRGSISNTFDTTEGVVMFIINGASA